MYVIIINNRKVCHMTLFLLDTKQKFVYFCDLLKHTKIYFLLKTELFLF